MNNEQRLDAAIRAARQGQREAAEKILSKVVARNPDNEEALLWLVRVSDSAETKRNALQRVLTLNPDNRWATEQLRALDAGEAAADFTPIASPTDKPQLEVLDCPNCNGAVELHSNAQGVKTVVCQYCDSILDLTTEQAMIVGQIEQKLAADIPIRLGMRATFEEVEYTVIGWLRYRGSDGAESWEWDEWLLVSDEGQFRWLSFSSGEGFTLQQKITPPDGFDPHTAKLIPVPDGMATVTERDSAEVIALAGELTWQGRVGNRINYLEAKRGHKYRYSVEYTDEEIELLGGYRLNLDEVVTAFGDEQIASAARSKNAVESIDLESFGAPQVASGLIQAFVVIFVFSAICLVCGLFSGGGESRPYVGQPVCGPTPTAETIYGQPTPPGIPATPCPTATPDSSVRSSGGGFFVGGFSSGSGGSSGGK